MSETDQNADMPSESRSVVASSGKRILLFVEDEVMFSLIREYIRERHPDFVVVNDDVEGIQVQHLPLLAEQGQADVVIWDLNKVILGEEVEITWALRILASRFPVILITPFGADDTQRKAKALGVTSYLSKPFKLSELGRSVSQIADQKVRSASSSSDPKHRMNSSA